MRLRDLTDRVVIDAIEAFYQQTSQFVGAVSRVVANHTYTLPRRGRRKGASEFPYFYAVDLYELFEFARGRNEMSPRYVEEKCEEILTLLHTTLSGRRVEPDWPTFADTPLGLCILACGARLSLRRPGGLIGAEEVMLLSDWSMKQLERSGLEPVALDAEEGEDAVRFRSAAVRDTFAELGLPV